MVRKESEILAIICKEHNRSNCYICFPDITASIRKKSKWKTILMKKKRKTIKKHQLRKMQFLKSLGLNISGKNEDEFWKDENGK